MNFNECSYELNEIFVKIENLRETPFCMTEHQIKNPGKLIKFYHLNILRSLHMTFYPIWSRSCGRWTDRRKCGRTDGWTDKAATVCSPFGEHNNVR